MVLNFTYFSFNDKFDKVFWCFNRISTIPISSDLIMQDLETFVLEKLSLFLELYYKYVDIVLSTQEYNIDTIDLNNFNCLYPRLKFTVKRSGNSSNFLDVMLIKKNNTLLYCIINIINQHFRHEFFKLFLMPSNVSKSGNDFCGLTDRFLLLYSSFHEKTFN